MARRIRDVVVVIVVALKPGVQLGHARVPQNDVVIACPSDRYPIVEALASVAPFQERDCVVQAPFQSACDVLFAERQRAAARACAERRGFDGFALGPQAERRRNRFEDARLREFMQRRDQLSFRIVDSHEEDRSPEVPSELLAATGLAQRYERLGFEVPSRRRQHAVRSRLPLEH